MTPELQSENHLCIQKSNIEGIKDDIHTIFVIIDGNGSGKGMKVDLALAKDALHRIEEKFSAEEQINREREIQARVAAGIQKDREEMYKKQLAKNKTKRETISLVIAAVALGVAALSFLSAKL